MIVAGIGIWQWASHNQGVAPDVVMTCCGDVPTLETLAAVSIMREHLPELKIRVVNVVDLMKLQPQTGDKGIYLKQQLKDKLIEHKQYIDKYGEACRKSAIGSGVKTERRKRGA